MDRESAYDFESREKGLRFLSLISQKGFKFSIDPNKEEDREVRFKDSAIGRMLNEQYLIVYTAFGEKRSGEREYNEGASLLQSLAEEFD